MRRQFYARDSWQVHDRVRVSSAGAPRAQKLSGSYGRFSQEPSTYVSFFDCTDPSCSRFIGYDQDPRVTPIPGHPSGLEPSRKSYTMAVSSCSSRRHCSGA